MNIFIMDEKPTIAAQYHNDVHLNKMLLESAQMLCNVRHHVGNENVTSMHETAGVCDTMSF